MKSRAPRMAAVAVVLLCLLTACTSGPGGTGTGAGGGGNDSPATLRILAGSEVSDLRPILDDIAKRTGITVKLDSIGTLDGAQRVTSGQANGKYDAIWFSSNRYVSLFPQAKKMLGRSDKIMASPVVLGLRKSVATKLGWVGKPVSWSDIATASAAKKFSYGMTDPSASNSGFSALVAVASAFANTGGAPNEAQIRAVTPKLTSFFASQTMSAGSSGWLSEAYSKRAKGQTPGAPVDGLINYESVLSSLNATAKLPEPLEIIYPSDGVVTADYPLTVLNSAAADKKTAVTRLATALKEKTSQQQIVTKTGRRPVIGGVTGPKTTGAATLNELPFPAQLTAINSLLASYYDKIRRPSRTIYVLDTSGSMSGTRITALRAALVALTGADSTLSGRFSRFRAREQVTLIPFSDTTSAPRVFTVPEAAPETELSKLRSAANALPAAGGTAVYGSLNTAFQVATSQAAADPNRFTSIVLMTDGESNAGPGLTDFESTHRALPPAVRGVPVFPVLFGESAVADMNRVAALTGGKVFDARSGQLAAAFKEIRGYQ